MKLKYIYIYIYIYKTPFIIKALATIFLVTLTNCDLNVYNHIPYKPLQDCDYRQFFFHKTTLLC
jgi:hypothetical protein